MEMEQTGKNDKPRMKKHKGVKKNRQTKREKENKTKKMETRRQQKIKLGRQE